ncbi:glycoside hydrolase family 43 protein [Saccharata proteae CBS 121410]|uniref:Glycoside hydrolase family 43 protein n=1 Tax=Saccharata proteae CBS 121410 TaxID=1314787 RepID=A0A9P4HRK5_9PEZI|nr:glycoside hydrolase family 43 protein [Saccharata proteae CBS 121410]
MKSHLAISENFADPSTIKVGDTWYAYATTNGKQNVQVATSTDFKTWELKSGYDALPRAGSWAANSDAKAPSPPAVWAPDVIENDEGEYVLFYSALDKDKKRHCVGAATSLFPDGPFEPFDDYFACHPDQGGSIDPSSFKDADGKRYVVYKVDGNNMGHGGLCGNTATPIMPTPLMLQRVSTNGHTKLGPAVQILDRSAADGPLIEAPSLTRTASGAYVLFFSSSCYSSRWYDIGYAVADNITGPYSKAGPWAVTGEGLFAPGGARVAADGRHVVFHAGNGRGGRAMYATEVEFLGEGPVRVAEMGA